MAGSALAAGDWSVKLDRKPRPVKKFEYLASAVKKA
jgi:hypothetical protein